MRRILVILAVLVLAAGSAEAAKKKRSAPSSGDKSRAVYANIGGFLYGFPGIGYQQAVGDDNAFNAEISFRSYGSSNFNVSFLGLAGGYDWFIGPHTKLNGWYAGPRGYIYQVSVNYDATTVSSTFPFTVSTKKESISNMIFGVGGHGGYEWVLPNGFMAQAGLDLAYLVGSLSLASGAPSIPFGGVGGSLTGSVGYAF